MKFKIGDEVKVTKAYIDTHLVGKILPITKIDGENVFVKGSISYWENGKWLKLIKSLNLKHMEFKAGQRVKIKVDCSDCKKGEICILHFGSKGGRDMSTLFAWGKNPGANCSCKNNWELFKGKTEKVMFIVTYDRVDRDPTETFSSKKELDEWLKQTKENKNIIYDSIKVYEVGKQYNVKVTYALKEVK